MVVRDLWDNRKQLYWPTFIFLLLFFLVFILFSQFGPARVRALVESMGYWGPVVLIAYMVVGHIVAPVSGMPAWAAGLALFGIRALFYAYIAGLISAVICFYISRYLGRPWVKRLAGEKRLEKMDRTLRESSTEVLVWGRIIGFPLFEFISYLAGFMPISFRKYYFITVIGSAIPTLLLALVLNVMEVTLQSITIVAVIVLLIGTIYAVVFHRDALKN